MRFPFFCCRFSLVSDVFCPSIFGNSPRAVSLNVEVVDSSNQSESPIFSPVTSPTISNYPIFYTIFFSPSCYADIMIRCQSSCLITENSSGIVKEFFSYSNAASDWTTLIDLVHHGKFSFHNSILCQRVYFCPLLSPTTFVWHTILAFYLSTAPKPVIMSICLII